MPRWQLVLLAFAFHYPGLRLLAGVRLDRQTARWNVVAAVATLIAMAVTAVTAARPLTATFYAWLIGHFVWSVVLSFRVARGGLSG